MPNQICEVCEATLLFKRFVSVKNEIEKLISFVNRRGDDDNVVDGGVGVGV